MAPRQADLLERRLNALGQELAALGIPLQLLECDEFSDVPAVLSRWLAAQQSEAGTTPVERSGADEKKAAKKAKKREAKEKKKAEEAQAVAAPATPQEVDTPAQSPVESSSGEEKKTGKKNKKKGK